MFKRIVLTLSLIVALSPVASRALVATEHAPLSGRPDAAADVEADVHDGHVQGDERLVPIPPSRDTLISALWVIIIFVIMLVILGKTAWKNVLAGLKAREQRIRKDIADAEAARARAEATLREYQAQLAQAENQVRDMLSKAAADGERIATTLRMQAQQDSEEIKERATRDIEAAKNQAISEIYEQAAVLATSVAEKILRRNLNAEDQRELVTRSLEQLQTIGRNA